MAEENAPATEQKTLAERLAEERALAEHEAALARLRLERAKTEDEVARLAQPMPAEEAAAQQAALAKLKLERATLERDLAKLARPWWRSWNVTALGAFIAAMAPLTTGVTGYFEKQKQIALETQKQDHEIAMARRQQDEEIRSQYLDRLKDVESRERVLRFIIATSGDPGMRLWADEEVKHVNESKSQLEKDLGELQKKQAEMERGQAESGAQRQTMQQRIDDLESLLRPMAPGRQAAPAPYAGEGTPPRSDGLPPREGQVPPQCKKFVVLDSNSHLSCIVSCGSEQDCSNRCNAERAASIAAGCFRSPIVRKKQDSGF